MPDAPTMRARIAAALAARPEVLEGYLFGSHARGEARAHSDVDVAVYVARDTPLDRGFGYAAELTTELMAALGENRVDVVVLNRASPLLYHRVLRDGERLFSRDLRATTVREGQALSRWCDWEPVQRRIDALLAAHAAHAREAGSARR